jgi:hypothetical protein
MRLFFGTAFLIVIRCVLCGVETDSSKPITIVVYSHLVINNVVLNVIAINISIF